MVGADPCRKISLCRSLPPGPRHRKPTSLNDDFSAGQLCQSPRAHRRFTARVTIHSELHNRSCLRVSCTNSCVTEILELESSTSTCVLAGKVLVTDITKFIPPTSITRREGYRHLQLRVDWKSAVASAFPLVVVALANPAVSHYTVSSSESEHALADVYRGSRPLRGHRRPLYSAYTFKAGDWVTASSSPWPGQLLSPASSNENGRTNGPKPNSISGSL